MTTPTFAQLTTIGVGGPIAKFIEPTSRVGVIEAVEDADSRGLPLCVIGGGSNILASDQPFDGFVIRDARRSITVPDEAAPMENGDPVVHINAEAGCNWDDFVQFSVELGLSGVEGLSGIPGTVGASVVQNIGAYGQEVSTSVDSVEVWDRQTKRTAYMSAADMKFSYRSSILKASMYQAPGIASKMFFPTPRYVVLSVTFILRHNVNGVVAFHQLAKALNAEMGARMPITEIRDAVLAVRAAKGMLEDAHRYELASMARTKRQTGIMSALQAQYQSFAALMAASGDGYYDIEGEPTAAITFNRHSCGSFFTNPVVSKEAARSLPDDAPRFETILSDGSHGIKTSAAWLIDNAGFHKGFSLQPDTRAGLSTMHTLALTNRGGASAADVVTLARTIRDGVQRTYGIRLVPEPVLIGTDLN
jgi:UDP-N-acetylmuramate dehydrogenase